MKNTPRTLGINHKEVSVQKKNKPTTLHEMHLEYTYLTESRGAYFGQFKLQSIIYGFRRNIPQRMYDS